jgi:hypothetical protein
MEQLRSTGRIFIKKFDIEWLSDICWADSNLTRMTGTLHEDLLAFMCGWMLLRMRSVVGWSCRDNQNIRFIFSYSPSESRAVY